MLDFIKNICLKKEIEKKKQSRQVAIMSLQKANRIGLLCDITDEDSYKRIFAVFSHLQAVGRQVWLIGYIDGTEVPFYCLQQLAADYFCKKDLNWFGKPKMVQIDDFLGLDFDIFIDFTKQAYPITQYMLTLTQAHFIVGAAKENAAYYDLFINSEELSDHKALLDQIYRYTAQLTGENYER